MEPEMREKPGHLLNPSANSFTESSTNNTSESATSDPSPHDPIEGQSRRTSGGILIGDAHTSAPPPVKMVGYLEKRSKMIGWKRYWFVLDGSLLTYYRSKSDHDSTLSPCLGSINLGLASSVRPLQIRACQGYPLQITTRTQIYYLRSSDKGVLDKWLIKLQETTSVAPSISSPTWADPGVQFYRYSFASGSQWSLALSTDDISGSLCDLPRNFYLKPGGGRHLTPSSPMSKSQSLACLNLTAQQGQPRASVPPGATSGLGNTMDKSTAVMPKPSPSTQLSAPARLRPGSLTNSPAPPAKPLRQATSMLVLNSITEAELRPELSAKISASLFKRSTTNLKEADAESPLESEGRDSYACAYDEIIDFEANYGGGGTPAIGGGARARSSTTTTKSDSGHSERESIVSSGSAPSSPVPLLEVPESHQRAPSPNRSSSPMRADVTTSRVIYHVEEEVGAMEPNVDGKGKKKKGIGGFFQKMFKKDRDKDKDSATHNQKRDRSGSASSTASSRSSRRGRASDRPPVITWPVDLRAATRERANTTGSTKSVTTPSTILVPKGDPRPPRSPQLDNMMAELKTKVEQINAGGKQQRLGLKVDIVGQPLQTLHTPPPLPPSTPRPKTPEHYENNLGKFNRLSAHLNPTFVAALNKGASSIVTGAPNGAITANGNGAITANGNCNGGAMAVHRSNTLPASGRYGHGQPVPKEEPPLLPPKKRRAGDPPLGLMTEALAPAYDVPQNNQPIPEYIGNSMEVGAGLVDMSSVYGQIPNQNGGSNSNGDNRQDTRTTLRDLTKKNSAPDIMFQSRPIQSNLNDHNHDLDILLQLNIVQPPSPPSYPAGHELHPMECPCQSWGQDEDLPPPLPLAPAPNIMSALPTVIVMDECGGNSPKSIEIDNLDALSDVSTGNASPPPPPFAYPSGGGSSLYPIESTGGGGNIYENLKYATINTIVEELETVEENEDELYDEFVIQDSHAVAVEKSRVGVRAPQPLPPTSRSFNGGAAGGGEEDDVFDPNSGPQQASRGRQSVRHSGIDALEQYLHQDPAGGGKHSHGGGAINKLGHSSAINQLHALLQNDDK